MSTVTEDSRETRSRSPERSVARWPSELWGAVAIAFMWVAVLFDGVYGGDVVSVNPGTSTTSIPSAVFVSLFAFLGTLAVAKRAFGRGDVSR